MNLTLSYNYTIAALLIVIYLALPATIFAHVAALEANLASEATYGTTTAAPCDNCPCSDREDSDCCDTTFCLCECHAPIGQGLSLTYSPMIATQSFKEPSWSLPQIFRPIFVPPQNRA